ncbi:MAG: SDR family NAD(P)-dependent oxidoreductase, partial [Mycolicibacterium sp.]|nr:SDR family NAD(P)-dependent oxidoreductase [Mycolicibacterium sp.]
MPDPLFDLTGKVCLVTGGSRGLGLSMITAFAQHGASVIVASRKGDACEAVAKSISASTGQRTMGVAFNVSHWADCDRLVQTAYDEFGAVDVLVNNAG